MSAEVDSRESPPPSPATQLPPALPKPERLVSLDAYRGFVMLAMASAGFGLTRVAKNPSLADDAVVQFLGFQAEHVPWVGCSAWDLIQPSFMFMVGVAMPYSYAARRAKGDSHATMVGHVLVRAALLVALGIFLSSNGAPRTNFTFVNVLTQIGLGYPFVFLLLGRGMRVQLLAAFGILAAYWLAFALFPAPGPDFDWKAVGVPADWPEHFAGLFAHWEKNANFASWVDFHFLNWFPRDKPFVFNSGGYQTLNFVPSMATTLFGVATGEWLRSDRAASAKLLGLILAGAAALALGFALGQVACPLVKRIWTPSWAIYSTGWTLWLLAAFFWPIDVQGWKRWAFPLVVVGANSIAIYCLAQLSKSWIKMSLKTHFGQTIFDGTFGPVGENAAILAVLWLVCRWMHARGIFIRI